MVTARILSEFSREMPGSDGGGVAAVFRLGFRKTISLVFATFSLRLLAAAQVPKYVHVGDVTITIQPNIVTCLTYPEKFIRDML